MTSDITKVICFNNLLTVEQTSTLNIFFNILLKYFGLTISSETIHTHNPIYIQ